jgi:hypothetical protein
MEHSDAQVEARSRESFSAPQMLLKPQITYGQGRTG